MTPLVSIIIPIYNAEKSIERTLRSIELQTYQNIEVLMINDGSTDHSEQICKKYEAKDSRFHFIHKKNSGVSNTRNYGIELAKGEYLQFVDSDDWLVKTATDSFVKAALLTGSEMVISDYYRVVGKEIKIKGHIPVTGKISRKSFAEYMMKAPANFYYGVLWNKFFKADIIREHKLSCSPDLDWCEDFLFNMEYLQYITNVTVLQKPLYYYVKTKGSLVDTKIDFKVTLRTKKILFGYYKELYQLLDLYDENKLTIQKFIFEFARDKNKKSKATA